MRKVLCPLCHKNQSSDDRAIWPFCSARCKETDLGKWARGDYRVPGDEVTDEQSSENERDRDSDEE